MSGVGIGVASVLVLSPTKSSLLIGMAGFLNSGAGTGGGSSASSPAELEGGVSSVGPSESIVSLCRRVEPVSSLLTSASNVGSHCAVLTFSVCAAFNSCPYALMNRPLTAVRRLSIQLRCSRLW